MIFTLQDMKLWNYIKRSARKPPELKEKWVDNKEKKKHIYLQ